jgi:hypothetical protein
MAEHEIHVVLKQEIWAELTKLTFNCTEFKLHKLLVLLTIYVKMQIYNESYNSVGGLSLVVDVAE